MRDGNLSGWHPASQIHRNLVRIGVPRFIIAKFVRTIEYSLNFAEICVSGARNNGTATNSSGLVTRDLPEELVYSSKYKKR